jgi:hypothetical protein
MKNRTLVIVVAFVVLVVGGWTLQGAKPQQWEYSIESYEAGNEGRLLKSLNNQGAQGWELVMTEPDTLLPKWTRYYFKRPKP